MGNIAIIVEMMQPREYILHNSDCLSFAQVQPLGLEVSEVASQGLFACLQDEVLLRTVFECRVEADDVLVGGFTVPSNLHLNPRLKFAALNGVLLDLAESHEEACNGIFCSSPAAVPAQTHQWTFVQTQSTLGWWNLISGSFIAEAQHASSFASWLQITMSSVKMQRRKVASNTLPKYHLGVVSGFGADTVVVGVDSLGVFEVKVH